MGSLFCLKCGSFIASIGGDDLAINKCEACEKKGTETDDMPVNSLDYILGHLRTGTLAPMISVRAGSIHEVYIYGIKRTDEKEVWIVYLKKPVYYTVFRVVIKAI